MHEIFGTLASIASFGGVLSLFGQAWTNYRRKSCEGFSPLVACMALCVYALWDLYALTSPAGPNWYMLIPYFTGLVASAILVYQLWLYRKPKSKGK